MTTRRALTLTTTALVVTMTLFGCDSDTDGDGFTKPGTELSFGDSAKVKRSDGAGTMSLTVEGVEEGDLAALEAAGAGDAVAGRTPYYLKVTVTPESGDTPIELKEYLKVFAGADALTHLSVFVPFEPCQEAPVKAEPTGESHDACLVYLREKGAPAPDSVYFANGDEYDGFEDTGIRWK